jgi:hypothetical protein
MVLVALVALAACGGTPAKTTSAPAGPSSSAGPRALTCETVVDTGQHLTGTWTAQKLIAQLGALEIVAGSNLNKGTITSSQDGMLTGAYLGLGTNRGSGKLESDAQDYAAAAQNYDPAGPVETVYADALKKDIAALEQDCPGSIPEAAKLAGV